MGRAGKNKPMVRLKRRIYGRKQGRRKSGLGVEPLEETGAKRGGGVARREKKNELREKVHKKAKYESRKDKGGERFPKENWGVKRKKIWAGMRQKEKSLGRTRCFWSGESFYRGKSSRHAKP